MSSKLCRHFIVCVVTGMVVLACDDETQRSAVVSEPGEATTPATSAAATAESWKAIGKGIETKPLRKNSESDGQKPQFVRLDQAATGIDFHNQLDRKNIKNYLLSGAGLAVGDIDGNGLPDLFLVSQDGANKLYVQTAPWKFEDVTASSGIVDTKAWGAGAAFADINNDGQLDLYVCNKGARDEIYLNQGDGTFQGSPVGGEPGLRAPTMVAFSDYDRDGDLDFYRTETRLLSIKEMFAHQVQVVKDAQGNWRPHPSQAREFEMVDGVPRELGTPDRLFRNDGVTASGMPKFVDATRASGIKIAREHGLAAVWWDFDNDQWPDLYVSNDFHTPDHLYRNNRDGTFTEVTADALPYTSWNSMGSDFADINNDGWFDYLSTDMSATTHFKQKTMMGAMTDTAWFLDHLEPRQYMRNAMQVNAGTGQFIDVAFYAGLDSTDWTWAGIFGDLDNDRFEDAFFTNGIERNVQDSDLSLQMNAAKEAGATIDELHELFLAGPRLAERNLAFKNHGEFRFEEVGAKWGIGEAAVSHGAVLADIDRDGDLDAIVNNMNDPIGIYRNDVAGGSAILVSLRGIDSNRFGLGARLTVELPDGERLSRIITSSRGYMSGVEPVAHFGLGENVSRISLEIAWPNGRRQRFADLPTGVHFRVTESDANVAPETIAPAQDPFFTEAEGALGIDFVHQENDFDDFAAQPLLPNRLSRFGPALAVSDAGFFAGGASGRGGGLFRQDRSRHFVRIASPALQSDIESEDVDAVWFDADGDDDLDLYVVSGGASKPASDRSYSDRLYLNDGSGSLTSAPDGMLPDWNASGSCVAPCDFDNDGDIDLFVGARFVPGRYPTSPQSALLVNEGGEFRTPESPVTSAGLVTAAVWADVDGDDRPDLVVATEWGPVKVYRNTTTGLVDATADAGLAMLTGWWTCLNVADLDGDGDNDLVAGNFGLNTKYHVDADHPATLYAADFADDGQLQLVEAQHKEGKLLPVRGRSCSTSAMPHLVARAPTYTSFASKTLEELYTPDALAGATRLEATTLASTVFRNNGGGHFTAEPLPVLAQMAPVMAIAIADVDGDQQLDMVLAQNFNAAQRETGRMNAGLGLLLKGDGSGKFTPDSAIDSGLRLRIDARQLLARDLNADGSVDLIFGANNDQIRVLLGKKKQ